MGGTLKKVINVIRGDAIVLTLRNNTLVVDAGKTPKDELQQVATKLFQTVYTLR